MTYKLNVLNDLPSAYWGLEEISGTSAADLSGSGRTLTFPIVPTLNQPGLVPGSRAIKFTADQHGTTDIKNIMVRGRENKNFGMEIWLKCSQPTENRLVMGRASAGIFVNPYGIEFSITQLNTEVITAQYTVVDWDGPMHVVANFTNNYLTITVNGEKGADAVLQDSFQNTSTTFYIGGLPTPSGTTLLLDEAAVYTRPVHARTLFRHLDQGNEGSAPLDVLQLFSGTYYSMSDDSVNVAAEVSEITPDDLYSGTVTGDLSIDGGMLVGSAGEKISRPYWLGELGIVDGSRVSYDASSGVIVEISLDGGTTWTQAANDSEIPGISEGTDLTGKFLQYRALFRSRGTFYDLASSDTTSLSVAEGSSSETNFATKSSSDAASLSVIEARSFDTVIVSSSDATSLDTIEGSSSVQYLKFSASDGITVSITDAGVIDITSLHKDTSDVITPSITDSGSVYITSLQKNTSDALTASITDSGSIFSDFLEKSSSDIISVSASEAGSYHVDSLTLAATDGLGLSVADSSSLYFVAAYVASDSPTVSISDSASIYSLNADISSVDGLTLSMTDSGTLVISEATYEQGYDDSYGPAPTAASQDAPLMTMGSTITETSEPLTISEINIPVALSRVRLTVYSSRNMSAHLSELEATTYGAVIPAEYPFNPALNREDMGAILSKPAYMKIPSQPSPTRTIDFWYKRREVLNVSSFVYDARTATDTGNPYLWFDATNVLGFAAGQIFYINGEAKTPTTADFPINTWVHVTVVFPADVLTPIFLNARHTDNEQGVSSIAHFSVHSISFSARDALVNHQMQTGLALNTVVEDSVPRISENSAVAYTSKWRGTVMAVR